MNTRCFMPALAATIVAGFVGLFFMCTAVNSADVVPAAAAKAKPVVSTPWVSMPAGARLAYIGIHGGTVPVSLLTSGDGSPMIARVGLTGSDFLHFMRKGVKPDTVSAASSETLGGELGSRDPAPMLPGKNSTLLMAGTAVGDVPVIYATGRSFEDMSLPANWEPFGLTEKALAAEGAVKVVLPPKKKPASRRPRS